MKTEFHTTKELVDRYYSSAMKEDAPLPLDVIPNQMGINLCSVEGMSWTRQDDGQLVTLTIHFIPAEKP